jgi:hypothetical protein
MKVAHRFIGGIRSGNMECSPCSGRPKKALIYRQRFQSSAARTAFFFRRDLTDKESVSEPAGLISLTLKALANFSPGRGPHAGSPHGVEVFALKPG